MVLGKVRLIDFSYSGYLKRPLAQDLERRTDSKIYILV